MLLRFSKQVIKDIKKESPAVREKLALLLDQLAKGVVLSPPVSKNMGFDGLQELRLKDEKGIIRVFYVIVKKDGIYILHLIRKKTQKTPRKDIDLALKRFKNMKG